MKPAVRQTRGPGMNLGLKKPRKGYIPQPKPFKGETAADIAAKEGKGKTTSLLPPDSGMKKPRAPRSPGGKSISSKL